MMAPTDTHWVAELWQQVRPHALAQAVELECLVRAAPSSGDALVQEQAAEIAHQLAGSVGSYGLTEASRLARVLEHRLHGEPGSQVADDRSTVVLAAQLRRAVEDSALGPGLTSAADRAESPRRARYRRLRSPRRWRRP